MNKKSLRFDGVDEYIGTDFLATSTNITISCWIKLDKLFDTGSHDGDSAHIFDGRHADNDGYVFYVNDARKLSFGVNTVDTAADADCELSLDKWYHVAASYDGSKSKLYINGQNILSKSGSTTISGNVTLGSTIGKQRYSSGNYFHGLMSDFAIWNST